MPGPLAAYLDGHQNGRLHLQHGPIDLVIGVDGALSLELEAYQRAHAFALAHRRFKTVLDELVAELPLLKSQALPGGKEPDGAVARRMWQAVLPFAGEFFITPMAAVAGAVADEVLAAMLSGFPADNRPDRIYVNNGGDIALHLEQDASFRVKIAREDGADLGDFNVAAEDACRGVATSGRGGRSLSMGIADSVTVLARNAASADAAATIIANAVDLPGHPAILKAPADTVVDDSDLGARLVTTGVGALDDQEIASALDKGEAMAENLRIRDLIERSALFLGRHGRLVAQPAPSAPHIPILEEKLYA
jgi:ApbE superfamily uncharacterized protein (UPF0280 family)